MLTSIQNYDWVEPIDDSQEAKHAAAIAEERSLGWFALPICTFPAAGETLAVYSPQGTVKGVQTSSWNQYGIEFPKLTPEELSVVKGSADL